jgi:hypothetical protein
MAQTSVEPVIRCPLCDKRDVVPTLQRRWWDWFFKLAMKFPWVCRACGWRFYVKRTGGASS